LDFWFENKPSGNPVHNCKKYRLRKDNQKESIENSAEMAEVGHEINSQVIFAEKHVIIIIYYCPCGVAQWTSHPPQGQKTRVRIPPGCKVFREIIALLLCVTDLLCIVRLFVK
jgi:hypothetical protein